MFVYVISLLRLSWNKDASVCLCERIILSLSKRWLILQYIILCFPDMVSSDMHVPVSVSVCGLTGL